MFFPIVFRNVSASACRLAGHPSVVATEPGRTAVTGTGVMFFRHDHEANLRPGQATRLILQTSTYCAARPGGGGGGQLYHHFAITLPGGGTVHVDTRVDELDLTCGLRVGWYGRTAGAPVSIDRLHGLKPTLLA